MMSTDPADFYRGREASQIKHLILRRYLEQLTYKIGSWCNTINYIEGFAGPWQSADEDLSDTSPHIALEELDKARDGLQRTGRTPRIRCLFVEEDPVAAETLHESLRRRSNTTVIQGRFLDVIQQVRHFIRSPAERDPRFTFLFLDPTGWTGYDPEAIAILLGAGNTEVMVNFMTKDIVRFVDSVDEATRRSFMRLFGSEAAWVAWRGLSGREREDAIVRAFCRRLQEVGGFTYVATAVVLNPTSNRTHFHLVYGTRNSEGLRAFRKAERATLPEQVVIRGRARQRARVQRTGQDELFEADEFGDTAYEQELLDHYHAIAREVVRRRLTSGSASFDEIELLALEHPMTTTSDLKGWLAEWKRSGSLKYVGLGRGERVPKPNAGHQIIWLESEST